MTVTVYRSSDASAPVLSSTPGSLVSVLDACLVNGYGSKTSAGWTKPYSGTSLAVYRQGAGNQLYLDVDDTGGNYAQVRGYETMTGTGTGTNPFPRFVSGLTGGLIWPRDISGGTGAVDWIVIATSKAFYFWNNIGRYSTFYQAQLQFFGDIISYRPNDAYHTMIIGNDNTITTTSAMSVLGSNLTTSIPGHYVARGFHQIGSSCQVGKHSDIGRCGGSLGSGSVAFPNPIDGSMLLAPVWVYEFNNVALPVRGEMPGLWAPGHNQPVNQDDTVDGKSGTPLAGKTILFLQFYRSNSTPTSLAGIEISNTW